MLALALEVAGNPSNPFYDTSGSLYNNGFAQLN
jgi:hypothetical protein